VIFAFLCCDFQCCRTPTFTLAALCRRSGPVCMRGRSCFCLLLSAVCFCLLLALLTRSSVVENPPLPTTFEQSVYSFTCPPAPAPICPPAPEPEPDDSAVFPLNVFKKFPRPKKRKVNDTFDLVEDRDDPHRSFFVSRNNAGGENITLALLYHTYICHLIYY
jgi:hypothetical protein